MDHAARVRSCLTLSLALGLSGCTGSPYLLPTATSVPAGPARGFADRDNAADQSTATTPNWSEQPAANATSDAATVPAEHTPQRADNVPKYPGLDNPIVRKLLAQEIDIVGEWENFSNFWGYRTLTVERDAGSAGGYHLHYIERLDLGDTDYERTAKLGNGIITLNEPVRELGMRGSRSPYTILYVLHTDDGDFIIPSVNAETVKSPGELGEFLAYKRLPSPR